MTRADDRAIAAGWERQAADDGAGVVWWTGPGDDADAVVWDCRGFATPRDCWASMGPSPAMPVDHPDEDAALDAALAAWGVA